MRLFVAICFPEDVKDQLAGIVKDLSDQAAGNFTRRENFHPDVGVSGGDAPAAGNSGCHEAGGRLRGLFHGAGKLRKISSDRRRHILDGDFSPVHRWRPFK